MATAHNMIWELQVRFQQTVQTQAKDFFQSLDGRLNPKVFLIGILDEIQADRQPICVEPVECGYEQDALSSIFSKASYALGTHPDQEILKSDQQNREIHLDRMRKQALQKAVLGVIRELDEAHSVVSFCSFPQYVGGYLVVIVKTCSDSHAVVAVS